MLDRCGEDRTEDAVSSLARSAPGMYYESSGSGPAVTACQHYFENRSFSRDVMRQSSRAVPRRSEILLEGLIDMGSRALHDRLEPAEPHLGAISPAPTMCD